MGLQTEDIIDVCLCHNFCTPSLTLLCKVLNRLSKVRYLGYPKHIESNLPLKVPVPETITNFIRERTLSYGKVKLVLKHNKYYVESSHPETLQHLLKDKTIRDARVISQAGDANKVATFTTAKAPVKGSLTIPGTKDVERKQEDPSKSTPGASTGANASDGDLFTSVVGVESGMYFSSSQVLKAQLTYILADEIDEDDENVHAFEIDDAKIDVSDCCASSRSLLTLHSF